MVIVLGEYLKNVLWYNIILRIMFYLKMSEYPNQFVLFIFDLNFNIHFYIRPFCCSAPSVYLDLIDYEVTIRIMENLYISTGGCNTFMVDHHTSTMTMQDSKFSHTGCSEHHYLTDFHLQIWAGREMSIAQILGELCLILIREH